MTESQILQNIALQREKLRENPIICVKERKTLLKKLYKNIQGMNDEISQALKMDLNKSKTESYMTEIGLVLGEIKYMLRHLGSLAKKKKVYTPISNFPAKSYSIPCPYGIALIISPWNYPVLLTLQPLVDAIAAGNRVVLKASEYSSCTTDVLEKLISKTFDPGYVCLIKGGVKECTFLLEQDFDYIFFTGSTRVGEIVMKKAAEHFTPVTLEMGGKSPCIVDKDASVHLAAKRIVFGKLLNVGQTCVAPDYLYCHKDIKDKLVKEICAEIIRQYSIDPIANKDYPKMISKKQFDAMTKLIEKDEIIFGGKCDEKSLKIEPTLFNCTFDDEAMKNEIFGPILPVLTFENLQEAVKNVNNLTKPLALYIFSNDKKNQDFVLNNCQFGGGCINDTIMHIANVHLGFGGIKHSGIGSYHGKKGFQTFSHYKSVVKKANWMDLPLRYQPFNKLKEKLIKMFLK